MDSSVTSTDILEALNVLSQALTNQAGNESEILQILIQLPSITGTYLPYDFTSHSKEASSEGDIVTSGSEELKILAIIDSVLTKLVKWLTEQLKQVLSPEKEEGVKLESLSQGKISRACEYVDYLAVLGGSEFAKEKFRGVLSRCVDLVLQRNMEYIADVLPNLKQVQENFTALVNDIGVIALDANKILFLCENFDLTLEQQMDVICDPILEKLSIELLTLVDALKEGLQKQAMLDSRKVSVSSSNLFSNLTSKIGDDMFMSRNEIVCFANIIKLFLDLESSLHRCEYTKLLREKSKVECGKKSALKQRSQLPDLLRSSQQSSLIRSSQMYGQWNWQEILKDIGPIVLNSFGKIVDECQVEAVNMARNAYHADDSCQLTILPSISCSFFSDNPGIPQKTISCFAEILNLMKLLLPFAILGSEYRPMAGLHSQYVDDCGQALKSLKSFLMTILNDVPSKGSISNLYHVLSTCEDVCTVLTYCSSKLQTETRVPFQGILQVYKDLNNTVRNVIIQHQSARLSTYLLHDAESHHWSDPREFNEGESCSYSIQMWNLFLKQLWSELGSCVSEVQRHKIFTEVFSSSLRLLQQRYALCTPSYNRTKQINLDITTILTICNSFLFHTEFHPTRVFPQDVSWSCLDIKHSLSQIHEACQNLLSVLCVVTSPLEIVQKNLSSLLRNNTSLKATKDENWLSWIHPAMYPGKWKGTFSDLPDKSAVYSAIHYAEIHPSQALTHSFYALVMRRCFLLKKMISHKVSLAQNEHEMSLEKDLFTIFSSCSHNFQEVFYKCAFKTTKQDPVTLLHACTQYSVEDFAFPWQGHFFSTLIPALCESLLKTCRYLHNLTWSTLGSSLITSLPPPLKKQIINLSESNSMDFMDNCLLVSLILTLQGISHFMYDLPDWLCFFLCNARKDCMDVDGTEILLHDPALHILASATCHILSLCDLWEEQYGFEFRRESVSLMQKTSSMFLDLCKNGKVPKGTKQIQDLVLHEMEELQQTSATLFAEVPHEKDEMKVPDNQLLEECSQQVQAIKANGTNALSSLERVSKVLVCSRKYVESEWGLNTYLGKSPAVNRELKENSLSNDTFNSLSAYNTIGDDKFNHEALSEFPWDWERLWSVVSAQDPNTIQYLLSHRWEMKEGAILQDNERIIVEQIRSAFSQEHDSDLKLGLQQL